MSGGREKQGQVEGSPGRIDVESRRAGGQIGDGSSVQQRRRLWGLAAGRGLSDSNHVVDSLRETVAALKHDLGKYVAWRSANLEPSAWEGPLDDDSAEAITRDVLATRTHAGVDEPAWSVWDRLTVALERPFAHDELVRVADAVERLRAIEPVLRAGDRHQLARARTEIRAAQQLIRRDLATLARRLAHA